MKRPSTFRTRGARARRSPDPRVYAPLHEAIIRCAYFDTFAPSVPAGLHRAFRRATRDADLHELRLAVLSHVTAASQLRLV